MWRTSLAKVSRILLWATVSSCASKNTQDLLQYPKASADASSVLQLQSNQAQTHFFIDGKPVGTAKHLKVMVNNQAHTIVAQVDGCIKKEEFVQPPYNEAVILGFTYLTGECGSASASVAAPNKAVQNFQTNSAPAVVTQIIVHDKKPPVINIINFDLRGANEVNEAEQIIQGQAVDENGIASVTIAGQETEPDAAGNFAATVALNEGANSIKVVAVDTEGNKSEKILKLKRTAQRPPELKDTIQESAEPDTPIVPGDFGKYYALVIGNNNYQYVPKLDTAENDAKEVAQVLTNQYGFKVKLLLSAKRADILDAVNEFKLKLLPKDNFIIYYAGHGVKQESAYWLPVDAKEDSSTEWIQAETLTTELKKISSEHILVISDSCFSGELSRGLTSTPKQGNRDYYLKKLLAKKSRTLIASGGNEYVADAGGGNHSVFTKALLEALKRAPAAIFTDEELFNSHIKEAVAGNADQTPQYSILRNSGHDYGSFIFVKQK